MKLVDRRGIPLSTTFNDLLIGDCYQDDEGNVCIKTSRDRCIFFSTDEGEWLSASENLDTLIIPLQATFIVERGE